VVPERTLGGLDPRPGRVESPGILDEVVEEGGEGGHVASRQDEPASPDPLPHRSEIGDDRGETELLRLVEEEAVGLRGERGEGGEVGVESLEVGELVVPAELDETACDVLRLALRRRSRRLLRLERLVRLLDSASVWRRDVEPERTRRDFVILDRSLHTHAAAAAGRGLGEAFADEWLRCFPEADATVLLDLPVEAAVSRIRARGSARVPDEKVPILRRWRATFLRRARRRGWSILDARADPASNRRAIASLALSLAES
jgi:thymidylate kinase